MSLVATETYQAGGKNSPLDDPNDQTTPAQQPQNPSGNSTPKSRRGEPDDSLNSTQLYSTSNPSNAVKQMCFIALRRLDAALVDEDTKELIKGKDKVDGLVDR